MAKEKSKDKRILTIFILMIPSLLIALAASIPSVIIRVVFQMILLVLQFVLVKNLIDDFYGSED